MRCRNPFMNGGQAHGCGQCLPCRLYRRRVWTHRILLEASLQADNCFVTLTYSDEHLPEGGTLVLSDMQKFIKRLRKAVEPKKFRMFYVGEYGDKTERPHYHMVLFGLPSCQWGVSRYGKTRKNCCSICDLIRDTWGLGNIQVGTLNDHSAQYVAGYTVKKMTAKDDARLNGRFPEFARMSNRPGIGAFFMDEVASTLMMLNVDDQPDVPDRLAHGTKQMPLGRYLRQQLRKKLGRDAKEPFAEYSKRFPEMLALQVEAIEKAKSVKALLVEKGEARYRQAVARSKIRKKRSSI